MNTFNPMQVPSSVMRRIGRMATTYSMAGGKGVGYVLKEEFVKAGETLGNIAWKDAGDGYFYPVEFKKVVVDGGAGYMSCVSGLFSNRR